MKYEIAYDTTQPGFVTWRVEARGQLVASDAADTLANARRAALAAAAENERRLAAEGSRG